MRFSTTLTFTRRKSIGFEGGVCDPPTANIPVKLTARSGSSFVASREQVSPQRVHQHCVLAHEKLPRPVTHKVSLLFPALQWNEPH